MTIVPLDTLSTHRELRAAGFSEEQADAVTRVVRKAQDVDTSSLATKSELNGAVELATTTLRAEIGQATTTLRAEIGQATTTLRAEIGRAKEELRAEIGELRLELRTGLAAAKSDLAEVKGDLRREISEVKADILKWMFGAIGFQTMVIVGAIFALARTMQP